MIGSAKWIRNETDIGEVSPIFSKNVTLRGAIVRATAYVTVLGVYELLVNGKKVGDAVLAPGWTDYKYRVQYQTYDITDYLTDGENRFDIHCGKGWACGIGEERRHAVDHISALAAIKFEYSSGECETVISDDSWSVYTSQVQRSEIYHGELLDLTAESRLVGAASIDDTCSGVEIFAQVGEYIRERERVSAKEYIVTPKGERVIDFGQNLAGYVEIKIKGKKGDRIVLSCAEVLDKDGNFYTDNYRSAKSLMEYVLNGEEVVLKPRFTFFGYRYIRLDEYPFDEVELDNFTSIAVYSDMKRIGNFSCGDAKINQLYSNIIWGQRSNFLDVPTDCPQRNERLGWTGDAQVFCRTANINYDASDFFKKWLGDMRVDQREDGSIPQIIPSVLSSTLISAAWSDAAVICPWELYLATGDKSFLEDNLSMMKRWVEYLHNFGEDEYGWMGAKHFGDWLAMDAGDGQYIGATQTDLIAGAFFAYSTSLLIKACKVLGEDTAYYEELYTKVRTHFRECFMKDGLPVVYPKHDAFDTKRTVKAITQTAIVLILKFDLCEESERKLLTDTLVSLIKENDNRMTTGFVGTPYILHALSENGRSDVAYELLFQEKNPSWLFSVNHGATTIWEHWDGLKEDGTFWSDDMNSFNHYAYGSVYDWIFGVCVGIKIAEGGAGYKRVDIKPTPCRRLGFADASIKTKGGTLRVAWRYIGDEVRYDVSIPEGTVANLTLPGGAEKALGAGEYLFVM